ncbi:dual OB domain-containing protein [Phormidesmis sp. 146-33]
MTQIICLANALKYGDRCIAGIDPTTGSWIRPISDLADGRITPDMRLIDGQEPEILDVLEIPLKEEPSETALENRSLLPGVWKRVGRVAPADVLHYCSHDAEILHNAEKYVTVTALNALPLSERRTVQLVYAQEFSVSSKPKAQGGRSWKGSFVTKTGKILTNAIITDPVLIDHLETGHSLQTPCLVTVSLGMPHRPITGWQGDDPCWKLITGAIELNERELDEIPRCSHSRQPPKSPKFGGL